MVQYYSGKHRIKWGSIYFAVPPSKINSIDVLKVQQSLCKKGFYEDFYTLHIDLMHTEDEIFKNIAKNTKYEINRAINKDCIITKTLDAREYVDVFCEFYNKFAQTKNRYLLSKQGEIERLIENNMFVIRGAYYNEEMIVCHTYITANGRTRLAHSASLFRASENSSYRNLVGRANRLLHWEDILYFKGKGYIIYDWGGYCMDLTDKEKQAINDFKKSFGGQLVKEYNSLVPYSLKGWLYILYQKIKTILD
jgi:lipid II:glycine glycyltransferase (peptidoglycan interpeptide bridge formation enzyme)